MTMKYSISKRVIAAAVTVASMALAGCSSTLSDVTSDGKTKNPVFPDPQKVTFNNTKGTFPNRDSLNEVRSGMTKDQLYYLLGRPHFHEGLFGVKEWDYLFHFNTGTTGKNRVVTCQFKVLFDKDNLAQSFFMRPVSEPSDLCSFGKPGPKKQRFDLEADGLFNFDKADLPNLTPEGRERLRDLARVLGQSGPVQSIDIVGYTDSLGSDAYNQQLSLNRAQTVKRYLGTLGVPMSVMTARGAGKTMAYAQCSKTLDRASLIACLGPNRRVTLEVTGVQDRSVKQ
ncbi:OmpA family protein [Advenella incenata]|uniref:OmpA family protein n=1 Tax=Advenella incenata TaxID=267800 RepID=A0A4Q7VV24_9BURK|nr:outer membrane protein assembly factor BamE [Advenella incenata]RZU00491.1 OmpA family protein [Advenella incenata]